MRRHSQVVRQGTANPRLPGSNPGGASSVGASDISLAPIFLQKSERAHSAAPPFQIATAALGCDLATRELAKFLTKLGGFSFFTIHYSLFTEVAKRENESE